MQNRTEQNSNLKHLCMAILKEDTQQFKHYLKKLSKTELNSAITFTHKNESFIETTPAWLACRNGRFDYFELLLDKGADPTYQEHRLPPLMICAELGRFDLVKKLTEKYKCNINAKDEKHGHTALHRACSNGHEKIVDYLLTHGADINPINKTGATPIILAINKNQSAIVQRLCKEKNLNLEIGCPDAEHPEITHFPISVAVLNSQADDNSEIVGALCSYLKQETNQRNKQQLMVAFSTAFEIRNKRWVEEFRKILKEQYNIANPFLLAQHLKLQSAISQCVTEHISQTIANGFDPRTIMETIYGDKVTLLRYAVIQRASPVIRMLVHDKKVNPCGPGYPDAITQAIHMNDPEALAILLQSSQLDVDRIMEITFGGGKNSELYQVLLVWLGIKTDADYLYGTYLFFAAINGRTLMVDMLLQKGANPLAKFQDKPILIVALANKKFSDDILAKLINSITVVDSSDSIMQLLTFGVNCKRIKSIGAFFNNPVIRAVISKDHVLGLLDATYLVANKTIGRIIYNNAIQYNLIQLQDVDADILSWLNIKLTAKNEQSLPALSMSVTQQNAVSAKSDVLCGSVVQGAWETISSERAESGRNFLLKELKFPPELVAQMTKKEKKTRAKTNFFQQSPKSEAKSFTWEDGLIDAEHLQEVRLGTNAYYIFPKIYLSEEIGDDEMLARFENLEPKFDEYHLKDIKDIELYATVNGETLKISHEAKIADEARLLICSILSDDKTARLYFPIIYLGDGIHDLKDIKALRDMKLDIEIDWEIETSINSQAAKMLSN